MNYSFFDLGGTLVDSVDTKIRASYEFVDERKLHISRNTLEIFLSGLSVDKTRTRNLVDSILGLQDIEFKESDYQLFRRIERSYEKKLIPGCEEFLNKLKERGDTIALVTNRKKGFSEECATLLLPKEIRHFFSASNIFYRKSDISPKKPDPQLYLEALKAMGAMPDNVIAYEDTPRGLGSAISAGIQSCIGMATSTYHSPEDLYDHGAKTVFADYTEIS